MQQNRNELILQLEKLAANTWPAAVNQPLMEWRLRANDGVTKRANSVLTCGNFPEYPDWMNKVTSFYDSRSLPPRYHVSAASPPELDLTLEKAGYIQEADSSVYTSTCEQVLEPYNSKDAKLKTIEFDQPDDQWFDSFLTFENYPVERKQAYKQIFSGIRHKTLYLLIVENEMPVGVGTAVREGQWVGLTNIVTAATHRRKGVGKHLLYSIAEWSLRNGADHLYLQVMADNAAAISLYHQHGFTHQYDYHYRTLYN